MTPSVNNFFPQQLNMAFCFQRFMISSLSSSLDVQMTQNEISFTSDKPDFHLHRLEALNNNVLI